MRIYGYARISKRTQKIERQIANIKKSYPDATIYQEAYTGTKIARKEFEKLLSQVEKDLKAGDDVTIIFDSVSRMSRNAEDGTQLYFDLYNKGVSLVFLKESYINTDIFKNTSKQTIDSTGNEVADIFIDATNKVIRLLATQQIEKAFEQAQKEVDDLHERTKEGMREARKQGHIAGRRKGADITTKKSIEAKELIRKYNRDFSGALNDTDTITQIQAKLGSLTRNTYYKYKKEMFNEL